MGGLQSCHWAVFSGLALRALDGGSVYDVDVDGRAQVVPGSLLIGGLVVKCEERPGVRVVRYGRRGITSGGDRG